MANTQSSDRKRLICVYNADTGLIEMLIHAVHKQLRPSTYPCSLCALTYGAMSMRAEWVEFWRSLDMDVRFYHRDDFTEDYPAEGTGGAREVALPAILIDEADTEPRVLLSNTELDAMADLDELIASVRNALGLIPAEMQAAV